METTYRSEYGVLLPAPVQGVTQGQSRYSVGGRLQSGSTNTRGQSQE